MANLISIKIYLKLNEDGTYMIVLDPAEADKVIVLPYVEED